MNANSKSAQDHRTHANKYRQTPWPDVVQPKSAGQLKDTEYPKHVKLADGAVRVAEDEEHEEALMSQGADTAAAQTKPLQTGERSNA